MPPRKSDVSKVATGDEGTPAKKDKEDGVNIEVNFPGCVNCTFMLSSIAGSEPSKVDRYPPGKRRPPGQYANTRQCGVSTEQERNCLR